MTARVVAALLVGVLMGAAAGCGVKVVSAEDSPGGQVDYMRRHVTVYCEGRDKVFVLDTEAQTYSVGGIAVLAGHPDCAPR